MVPQRRAGRERNGCALREARIVSADSLTTHPTGGPFPHMIARSAVSSLLFASVILASATALADPWLPEPGDRYYELRASVFSADSYYDLTGNRSPLNAGGLHEERGFVSYSEFGWKKNMFALLEIPALSVTRRAGAPGAFNA